MIKNKDTIFSVLKETDKLLTTGIHHDSVSYNLIKKGNKFFYHKGLEQKNKKVKNWKIEKDLNIIFSTELSEKSSIYIFDESGSIYLLDLLKMKLENIYTHKKRFLYQK
ncbi:hypothetical protein ACE193_23685 [Bernardetia sp. OM2101]|uniref:hypothetical protein n=1 Tax=Bernardetia sp. OM2101 TaxID=3344876 RepID=UPI0035CEB543